MQPPPDTAASVVPDTPPFETSAPAGAEAPDQQEAPSAATALLPARPEPDDATLPPADRAPVPPHTQ